MSPEARATPRVCLVGPLPPPSGGMANQCAQLLRLLRADGVDVELVRTNPPHAPAWVGRVPVVRALFRLVPYLFRLWSAIGRADVVHVLANSGWSWHLFAAPALRIARWRGKAAIVNYRGGEAESFLRWAPAVVRQLRHADLLITPSDFLRRVFASHGLQARVIPNVLEPGRFVPDDSRSPAATPRILVARNLEPIYGLDTAIESLALLRRDGIAATMTIAGSGPQLDELCALAVRLHVEAAVEFTGRVEHARMPALYAASDLALNPSTVDNMPNSVMEAFASGVPVVTTDAGGVPDLCRHEHDALLVPVGDAPAMAAAMARVLGDAVLRRRLRARALERARAWDWSVVRGQWLEAYREACVNPPRLSTVNRGWQ